MSVHMAQARTLPDSTDIDSGDRQPGRQSLLCSLAQGEHLVPETNSMLAKGDGGGFGTGGKLPCQSRPPRCNAARQYLGVACSARSLNSIHAPLLAGLRYGGRSPHTTAH